MFFLFFLCSFSLFFFFNDTATTEIYTLSLHDALPISQCQICKGAGCPTCKQTGWMEKELGLGRSEEHTSELQSLTNLVCRLLLEKKKKKKKTKKKNKKQIKKAYKQQKQNNKYTMTK